MGAKQAAALARCARHVLAVDADPSAMAAMLSEARVASEGALGEFFSSHPALATAHAGLAARVRLLLSEGDK
jgi:hypothetical protein